jgi:hypothetical protein
LHGLASVAGSRLNGRFGTISRYDGQQQRFGVEVDGVGLRAIKVGNLTCLPETTQARDSENDAASAGPGDHPPMALAPVLAVDPEELVAQSAIEASLHDTPSTIGCMQGEREVNAQVSDAVLRSRLSSQVVLLTTFSRSPKTFRDALLRAPELEQCRQALQARGFEWELPSGAKLLVQPQDYEAVLWFIRESGHAFLPRHVFADPALSDAVIGIVDALPKREKIYRDGTAIVPLSFAANAVNCEQKVSVLRTFVDISHASSSNDAPRTVSTTDADARKGPNHRSGKPDKTLF